jgi:predicted DsbA family dithiol-disulfide isomerase
MINREALFSELQDRVLKLRDAIKELGIDAQEEFKQKLLKADALSAQVAALAAEADAKINERDRRLFELTYLSKVNISADDIDEEL